MALEMKEACETCEAPLPHNALAYMCSYECTFCAPCTDHTHKHICPNCGGGLVKRPTRALPQSED